MSLMPLVDMLVLPFAMRLLFFKVQSQMTLLAVFKEKDKHKLYISSGGHSC